MKKKKSAKKGILEKGEQYAFLVTYNILGFRKSKRFHSHAAARAFRDNIFSSWGRWAKTSIDKMIIRVK